MFSYKCTAYYSPGDEGTVLWSDPEIGVEWPVEEPTLSAKDRDARPLRGLAEGVLPDYS